nr:reverse transcriptase domain-containing protein [Tanacetum cinerariifolium]
MLSILTHVNTKETKDKSKEKRLEDALTVPGAAPIARAPYRLAPFRMKDWSKQLKELSDKGSIRHSSSPWGTPIVGHEAAYGMTWKTLIKMMTEKYCPRNEIRKLEIELWDLKVKGTDKASYTQRYQELALLCGRIFSEESDKIEKYVEGLPDMIHGSVVASKPKTMKEAIEIATELMDKKIRT